jgi:hypothetical protein
MRCVLFSPYKVARFPGMARFPGEMSCFLAVLGFLYELTCFWLQNLR